MNEAQETTKLYVQKNGSGVPCYVFRYWETQSDGKRKRRKREVGKVNSMTVEQAEQIIAPWKRALEAHRPGPLVVQTMGDLIEHFRFYELSDGLEAQGAEKEMSEEDDGEEGDQFDPDERSYSTRSRYNYVITAWIEPRWAMVPLKGFVAGEVEQWLHNLKKKPHLKRKAPFPKVDAKKAKPLAPGTRFKIRSLMSVLFNHAIRWGSFRTTRFQAPHARRECGKVRSGRRLPTFWNSRR